MHQTIVCGGGEMSVCEPEGVGGGGGLGYVKVECGLPGTGHGWGTRGWARGERAWQKLMWWDDG